MMVILPFVLMYYIIIFLNTKPYHGMILDIFSVILCMVVILQMNGIEEQTEPILKLLLDQNYYNQHSTLFHQQVLLVSSNHQMLLNSNTINIEIILLKNYQLNQHTCSTCIQMLKSVI